MTGTTDKPLAGVEFLITDSSGAYVGPNKGIYKTDEYGRTESVLWMRMPLKALLVMVTVVAFPSWMVK